MIASNPKISLNPAFFLFVEINTHIHHFWSCSFQ